MTLASRSQQRLTKNVPVSRRFGQECHHPSRAKPRKTAFGTLRPQDRSSASSTTSVLVHDRARCSPVRRDSGRFRRRWRSSRARVRSPHNPDKRRSPVRGNRCWQRASEISRPPPRRFRGRLVLQSMPDSEAVVERCYERPRVRRDETHDYVRPCLSVVDAGTSSASSNISRRRAISTELARRLRPHITRSPWLGDIEIG